MSDNTSSDQAPSRTLVAGRLRRPLERVEAEIVELASQLTAATCRLLVLVAEFDAAEAWREWGMRSTAQWLSWQCGVGATAAREQVRVARALAGRPVITAAFATGRLSYSKVRAITRIVTDDNEVMLVEWAEHATAAQIERIVAAQRRVVRVSEVRERKASRYVDYHWDDDGSLVGTFRLPPEDAAVFLQGLDAARRRLPDVDDHQPDEQPADHQPADEQEVAVDASAEAAGLTRSPAQSNADALVLMATRVASGADEQSVGVELVVHASAEALAVPDDADDNGQPITLEFGAARPQVRIHPSTARRLVCGCSTSVQIDDADGNALHLGRRTRRIRGRLARAVQRRDGGRCQAPGCTSRATQIHHIRHWANGGPTCLPNLISLCDAHHWLVHEGGWTITSGPADGSTFWSPSGRRVAAVPQPRAATGSLRFDPAVRADAVVGQWCGGRLRVNDALVCLNPPAAA